MAISLSPGFFCIMHDGLESKRETTHALITCTTMGADFQLVMLTLSCHTGYPL